MAEIFWKTKTLKEFARTKKFFIFLRIKRLTAEWDKKENLWQSGGKTQYKLLRTLRLLKRKNPLTYNFLVIVLPILQFLRQFFSKFLPLSLLNDEKCLITSTWFIIVLFIIFHDRIMGNIVRTVNAFGCKFGLPLPLRLHRRLHFAG